MSVKLELRVLLSNTGEEMHHTGYGWEGSNKTPKRKSGDKDSPYQRAVVTSGLVEVATINM